MRILLSILFFSLILTGQARAGEQDFTLINATGFEIAELYVSPASVDDWQEDVLTMDTLLDGQEVNIHFSRKEDADFWDIKIVNSKGKSLQWSRLKLTKISKVILSIEDGVPVATYK